MDTYRRHRLVVRLRHNNLAPHVEFRKQAGIGSFLSKGLRRLATGFGRKSLPTARQAPAVIPRQVSGPTSIIRRPSTLTSLGGANRGAAREISSRGPANIIRTGKQTPPPVPGSRKSYGPLGHRLYKTGPNLRLGSVDDPSHWGTHPQWSLTDLRKRKTLAQPGHYRALASSVQKTRPGAGPPSGAGTNRLLGSARTATIPKNLLMPSASGKSKQVTAPALTGVSSLINRMKKNPRRRFSQRKGWPSDLKHLPLSKPATKAQTAWRLFKEQAARTRSKTPGLPEHRQVAGEKAFAQENTPAQKKARVEAFIKRWTAENPHLFSPDGGRIPLGSNVGVKGFFRRPSGSSSSITKPDVFNDTL